VPFGYGISLPNGSFSITFKNAQKEKGNEIAENKYYKSDQFGYTSIEASKCSSISQLHYGHLMLLGENCPITPGNLSRH
jgi:hypothetical protein